MRSPEVQETVIHFAILRKGGWRVLRTMTVPTFLLSLTLVAMFSTPTFSVSPLQAPVSEPTFSGDLSNGELLLQTQLKLEREDNQKKENEKLRGTSDIDKPTGSPRNRPPSSLEANQKASVTQKNKVQYDEAPSENFVEQEFLDASEEKLQELEIILFDKNVTSGFPGHGVNPVSAASRSNATWISPCQTDILFSAGYKLVKPRALLSVSTPASPYPAPIHPSLDRVYRSKHRVLHRRSLTAIPSSQQERKRGIQQKTVYNATVFSTAARNATRAGYRGNVRPPLWSLETHFGWTSLDDPYYHGTIAVFRGKVQNFHALYKGNVALDIETSIIEYEHILSLKARIVTFAQLNSAVNSSVALIAQRIKDDIQEQWTDHMLFYELELGEVPNIAYKINHTESLSGYKAYLQRVVTNRFHSFSLEMEEALQRGRAWYSGDALVSVYEQELENARFELTLGKDRIEREVTLGEILGVMQSRNIIDRQQAIKVLNVGIKEKGITKLAAALLNVIAGSGYQESRARNYSNLRSRRNSDNEIPDSVVDDALEVVRTTGVELLKRYRQLKHQIQTKRHPLLEFTWVDTLSPTDFKYKERYTWGEAVQICEESFKTLPPQLQALFRQQLEEKRVHARLTRGKVVGEYTIGVSPTVGSFQLLNFLGNMPSVLSLAHEGGHATHLALSFSQPFLEASPTITLSEIAATFSEIKVFEHLFKIQENPTAQLGVLLEHIDRLLTAVIRQAQYDAFEILVHNTYQTEGILSEDRIADLWLESVREFDDDESRMFTSYDDLRNLWGVIHHLYLTPFYVNSYVLAEIVAGALAIHSEQYPRTFEKKYLELLRSGSSKSFVEALEPFGFNLIDQRFWENALKTYIEPLIEKAEQLTLALL